MTQTAYWLSSRRLTVLACVRDGILVETAPVTRWALGKPIERLVNWMKAQQGFEWAVLSPPTAREGDK